MTENLDRLNVDVTFDATGRPADLEAAIGRSLVAGDAAGWLYVSLLHGDPETEEDAVRLAAVRRVVEQFIPDRTLVATRGGNDWTTWCLRGHRAGLAQLAIVGALQLYGASWWRYSLLGTPPRSLADGRCVSQDAANPREAGPGAGRPPVDRGPLVRDDGSSFTPGEHLPGGRLYGRSSS